MKRNIVLYAVILAVIALILITFLFPDFSIAGKAISLFSLKKAPANAVMVPLNKDNFPLIIQSQGLIQDLPKNAVISLKLYNFNSGKRAIEETYTITKASVKKGEAKNPDISIQIHSKYISEAGDICSAIKKANANRDFGYELHSGRAGLLFKYSGMMKHKGCFS